MDKGWWYATPSFNGVIHFNTGETQAKQNKGIFIKFADGEIKFMIDGKCQLSIDDAPEKIEDTYAMCDEFSKYVGLVNGGQKSALREIITECFY